jgi:hypothetical protein
LHLKGAIRTGVMSKGEYVTGPERKKDVNEFRATHFIMGKHPTTMNSQSRHVMLPRPGLQSGMQNKIGSKQKSQSSNFSIGIRYEPRTQFATTYQKQCGQRNSGPYGRTTLDDIPAKKTSILLGKTNRNGYVTTSMRTHTTLQRPPSVNQDFKHEIKASHFEYGNGRAMTSLDKQNHFVSLTGASYTHKGNAVSVKAKLDQSKKEDLRRNHFTIGGPSANIKKSTS